MQRSTRANVRRAIIDSLAGGLGSTIAIALLFRTTDLDLRLQALAFRPTEPHWPLADVQPWLFLHDYATWPGLALALSAVIGLGVSFVRLRSAWLRYPSLFIFMFMAIGPGLVTNILGKALCGRPRPDEIIPFGGPLRFHAPFELGTPGGGFSFLCGHCSMGFLFLSLFYLLHGWRRWVALVSSILFGVLIGVGRVVQAAHFPSDILLEASVMFTVAAALSPIAALTPSTTPRSIAQWKIALITSTSVLLLIIGFLFSTPVHKQKRYRWIDQPKRTATLHESVTPWRINGTGDEPKHISIEVKKGDIDLAFAETREPLRISSLVTGFGFPGAGVITSVGSDAATATVFFRQELKGLFWESHGRYEVRVPASTRVRLQLKTSNGRVVIHTEGISRAMDISGAFSRRAQANGGDPISLSIDARHLEIR